MKKQLLVLFLSFIALSSCKKDNDTFSINQKEVKLKYDGEFGFKVEGATTVEWSSSDEFVGSIGNNGEFKAKHIGETTITGKVNNTVLTAKVIVEPTVKGVIEPYTAFGNKKAQVKSYEKRELKEETATGLAYIDNAIYTRGAIYLFENEALASSALLWNNTKAEELAKFYIERYQVLGENSGIYYFTDKESTKIIGITFNETLGAVILYAKYPVGTKSTSNLNMFDKLNIKGTKLPELDRFLK